MRESRRDLWRDVLSALLDRLEEGKEDRQLRIVGLLGELLPTTLANGQFDRAASLLAELSAVAARPGVLAESALRETDNLFRVMGSEDTVSQLTSLLEESPGRLSDGVVERLLGFLPSPALGPLMRAADQTQQPAVRRTLEACIARLAASAGGELAELLRADDRAVVIGALRWIGRLKMGRAGAEAVRHLRSADPGIRAEAATALGALGAPSSGTTLLPLLEDPEREVRIAAVRGLGSLGFAAARQALESALSSKRLHEADRTEKIAFFESYGRLAGSDGVPMLDRILNSRNWMGRSESAEYRACSALALARIRDPPATKSLNAAANDKDPVVRAAVMRALRGETD